MDDPDTVYDLNWLPDAIPCAAAVVRAGGRLCAINGLWRSELGENLDAWARGSGADADTVAAIIAGVGGVLAGRSDKFEFEFAVPGPDGGSWWLLQVTGPGHGARDVALVIQHDVGEARRQKILADGHEARLRSILDIVPDAMIVIDERGVIQSFSNTAQRLFGFAAAEVIGGNIGILMPSPFREAHDGYLAHYRETGEQRVIGTGRVVVARRKDGTTFSAELQVAEVGGSGSASAEPGCGGCRYFVGFLRDLTEKHANDARLQELQTDYLHESRLHSLGEMAAQLAHELNQPLAATSNYLKAALMLLDRASGEGDPGLARLRQAMELAAQQTTRAGEIIQRLREFVARGKTQMRPESIGRLIEEASALALVGAQQNGIATHIFIAPGLPRVQVDRVQIQQVLLNLMRNAIEAMDASPTRQLDVGAELVDDTVRVSVTDTGEGIAPGVAGRLFQPFVTTKATGMGIGLSTCRAIIEAHGGRLWWEPVTTGGTRFCFTLPLRHEETAQA